MKKLNISQKVMSNALKIKKSNMFTQNRMFSKNINKIFFEKNAYNHSLQNYIQIKQIKNNSKMIIKRCFSSLNNPKKYIINEINNYKVSNIQTRNFSIYNDNSLDISYGMIYLIGLVLTFLYAANDGYNNEYSPKYRHTFLNFVLECFLIPLCCAIIWPIYAPLKIIWLMAK